jgi:2'-5' RNA ligase
MTLKTNGVASFGWKPKLVLRLNVLNNELIAIRSQAETILRDANLPWSVEWLFSPHITIGGQRAKTAPPTTLRFDRMEWR